MGGYTRTKGRGCDGKQPFPDKRSAGVAIAIRVREGAARNALEAYRCARCVAWHVGHRSRKKRGRR